jgi:hypothetical protein
MSNFPMPENLLKHIENLLTALPQEIETYSKLPKASLGPVKQLLAKFNGNPLIASRDLHGWASLHGFMVWVVMAMALG